VVSRRIMSSVRKVCKIGRRKSCSERIAMMLLESRPGSLSSVVFLVLQTSGRAYRCMTRMRLFKDRYSLVSFALELLSYTRLRLGILCFYTNIDLL
jgi:hypothetical protein